MTGRPSKFGNVRTEVDGINFASKREARRYGELKMLEKRGMISGLKLQVRYKLAVNGHHICDYIADFVFTNLAGETCVHDAKGMVTPLFSFKQKMMKAIHGIDVVTT